MRILILVGWLLVPLPVLAFHLGPGQQRLKMDEVSHQLRVADRAAKEEKWLEAVEGYEAALASLPEEMTAQGQRIRLEKAKAQMLSSQLPEAHADLRDLVDELRDDPAADQELFREAREAHANSQYYMTWLLRREGKSRDEWEPEIQGARQTLVALAEEAESKQDETLSKRYREDLESSIRLARMDLADLQGLPLPSQ